MASEADFPTDLEALERDYELIRELGRGGMAAVYLARRRDNGRVFAIKAIRARYLDDPDVLQRFAREARTVADLDHPNIVRTEAIEEIGDRAVAIIMEYIAGGTVRDRLREYGAFSAEATENVLRDVANALAYAHRRGIVHRDVKPENVFLDHTTGRALLSDFGIARRIDGDSPITQLGAALGTPHYMSPEQIDGRRVDGRSDIYSVGVLGWELLTGRRPWAGENLYSIIYKQKHERLPPITTLRPRVPANLLVVIERALEKDPALRWQSAEELVEHLTYEPPPVLTLSYPHAAIPDAAIPHAAIPGEEATLRFHAPQHEATPPRAAPAPVVTAHAPDRGTSPARQPVEGVFLRRPIVRMALFVVPLLIALGALYVVLDLPTPARESDSGTLTSSGGAVALDSTPPDPVGARPRLDSLPPNVAVQPPRKPATPPSRDTLASRRPAAEPAATKATPAVETPPAEAARSDGEPTRRCGVATLADQRACLLAYIAVNDSRLQRVYDSLIVELRRIERVPRRAADPPAVTRLRVEQRAWIAARDRECMRGVARPSTTLWAGDRSACFAGKSEARERELRARLNTARRQDE
jgi:serine/threonine protein kinase/uncharacterized protein YecT (DUF1311 family)